MAVGETMLIQTSWGIGRIGPARHEKPYASRQEIRQKFVVCEMDSEYRAPVP
jgi:hypothetical protein